jgi:uncharacterized protein (TIGR02996 family)
MARRANKLTASVRPEEQALHQAIVDNPADESLWLILADWLEEHDDLRRAELLRLHRQLITTCCEPQLHPERAQQQARMVKLLMEGVQPSVPRQVLSPAPEVEMTFAWIPSGHFLMGSPEGESEPVRLESRHLVTLTQGYWLAVTPVTQEQWQAVTAINPSHFKGRLRPVEHVSWQDCKELCRRLGKKVGHELRLPTEAEWEYACRAGTTTPFFFGEALSTDQANYNSNFDESGGKKYRPQTSAVGSFPCNGWGLYDMHGNVLEWCQDGFARYPEGPVRDPRGPTGGSLRVLRGGSYRAAATMCRSACRSSHAVAFRSGPLGCRVVLDPR